jgi:polysaccharide export outer membrane protein
LRRTHVFLPAVLAAGLATTSSGQSVPAAVTAGTQAYAQPGDQLRITVWPQSAFGPPMTAVVDPQGNIVVPPAGQINVGRIPIKSLRDTLLVRLSTYIVKPEVDVQVLRRVTVNGAVLRPDVYFMDVSATLRDAIARAGGVTEVGARSKVYVIRNGQREHVANWESDVTDASVLRSGDQVLVGRRSWIEINIIPVASLGLATASFLLSLRR